MKESELIIKGRGAQLNPHNPFHANHVVEEHYEGLDEPAATEIKTAYFTEHPKKIVNKVPSPDIGLDYSANPYQGCEHGCVYCYARNVHTYWGFSAGIDFESKIIIKHNAAELLEKQLRSKRWKGVPIMLSGNTDCYQPIERKMGLTRKMLEVCVRFNQPVGIITKNALITRDLDLLRKLSQQNLVHVNLSITSVNEKLRREMEPRTASSNRRFQTMKKLADAAIPVGVMAAPVIPGLNDHEIPNILKRAAENGASWAGYTVVRLNGDVGAIFTDWIKKAYPDRAEKVLRQIASCHGGALNDTKYGRRIKGDGSIARYIQSIFQLARAKYFENEKPGKLNRTAFRIPDESGQMNLFR